MTAFAHKILGNVVPNVSGLVQITDSPHDSHAWGPPRPEYASRTRQVTGFLDRGLARITPSYFEHVAARLACGQDPRWRKVLLEVLRQVLRIECDRAVGRMDTEQDLAV
ncbi:hypothetical protein D6C85_01076 [Aureobasidium pullulans]|uniref:Uncharacterized protein n=1 Tax=Aureobasidium pullulans TaxID=5580 RepID=A0A4S9XG22_AURPU|nr:hypothetical protein D6C85_01076 [Aureobasidium pullulans]